MNSLNIICIVKVYDTKFVYFCYENLVYNSNFRYSESNCILRLYHRTNLLSGL